MTGAEGGFDDLIEQAAPMLSVPSVRRRAAVLVTGPWLAGSSSVAAALRDRAGTEVIEADELCPDEAVDLVVFVVSAVAPLTESDCAVLDAAAAHTDAVVAVVSKTDLHQGWREVLQDNRSLLAAHASRYTGIRWVGAAAAPDLGAAQIDDLVEQVRAALDDADLGRRNRLRALESRLAESVRQYETAAAGAGREALAAGLRRARAEAVRRARLDRSERTIALRSQIQQARVQLSYFARGRCTSVRTELQEDAAAIGRADLPGFASYVRTRVGDVVGEVDDGVTEHFADVAGQLGLPVDSVNDSVRPAPGADSARPAPGADSVRPAPDIGDPPLRSHRLENRLMMLLGAGFGLGVALTLSRLFSELAPGLAVAGAALCVVVGVGVTVWVVGMRGLLRDRAVLDRWVGEAIAALRASVDRIVASRVLAAETSLTAALAAETAAGAEHTEGRIAEIDAELRAHAMASARAAAARDRAAPAVLRALAAVRAELADGDRPGPGRVDVEDWVDADVSPATCADGDLLPPRVPGAGAADDPAVAVRADPGATGDFGEDAEPGEGIPDAPRPPF